MPLALNLPIVLGVGYGCEAYLRLIVLNKPHELVAGILSDIVCDNPT